MSTVNAEIVAAHRTFNNLMLKRDHHSRLSRDEAKLRMALSAMLRARADQLERVLRNEGDPSEANGGEE